MPDHTLALHASLWLQRILTLKKLQHEPEGAYVRRFEAGIHGAYSATLCCEWPAVEVLNIRDAADWTIFAT